MWLPFKFRYKISDTSKKYNKTLTGITVKEQPWLEIQLLCDWCADKPKNNKGKNFLHLEKQHQVTLNRNFAALNHNHNVV